MALTWDVTKVKDWQKKADDTRLSVVREALVFGTMAIGINKITEQNAVKFYARLRAWELIHGNFIYDKQGNRAYITLKEVREFIGLCTNASTYTPSQFESRLVNVDVNSINDED